MSEFCQFLKTFRQGAKREATEDESRSPTPPRKPKPSLENLFSQDSLSFKTLALIPSTALDIWQGCDWMLNQGHYCRANCKSVQNEVRIHKDSAKWIGKNQESGEE